MTLDVGLDPAIERRLLLHFERRLRAVHGRVCRVGGISDIFAEPERIRRELDERLRVAMRSVHMAGLGHLVVGYPTYANDGDVAPWFDLLDEPTCSPERPKRPAGWRSGPWPVGRFVYERRGSTLRWLRKGDPLEGVNDLFQQDCVALVVDPPTPRPSDPEGLERLLLDVHHRYLDTTVELAQTTLSARYQPMLAEALPQLGRSPKEWDLPHLGVEVRGEEILEWGSSRGRWQPVAKARIRSISFCTALENVSEPGWAPSRVRWTRGAPAEGTTDLSVHADDSERGWRMGGRYVADFESDARELLALVTGSRTLFHRAVAAPLRLGDMAVSPWHLRSLWKAPMCWDHPRRLRRIADFRLRVLWEHLQLDPLARFVAFVELADLSNVQELAKARFMVPIFDAVFETLGVSTLRLGWTHNDAVFPMRLERAPRRRRYRMVLEA